MSRGDFHTHSTRSDGTLAPAELVRLAWRNGVRVLALTDHDTLEGIAEAREAAADLPGMRLVPGVELSCDLPGTELHILGLFVDPEHAAFTAELARFREGRVERGRAIVGALERLGAPIDWRRVQEIAGDASIGRPHIAQALLERGHVASIREAFDRFLAHGGPAYVGRDKLEPEQALEMIAEAGGVSVFAHPSFSRDYPAIAGRLAAAGLFGMEVYYKDYAPEVVEELRALALSLDLFPLGGSDYHALAGEGGREPGDIPLPDDVVEQLLDEVRRRGCRVPEPALPRAGGPPP
ncbi:MAG: PHP domain-containing protein [Chloroflexi bacterium]|nr:PHP domain-containing protein [Chloroflexota bacterium]